MDLCLARPSAHGDHGPTTQPHCWPACCRRQARLLLPLLGTMAGRTSQTTMPLGAGQPTSTPALEAAAAAAVLPPACPSPAPSPHPPTKSLAHRPEGPPPVQEAGAPPTLAVGLVGPPAVPQAAAPTAGRRRRPGPWIPTGWRRHLRGPSQRTPMETGFRRVPWLGRHQHLAAGVPGPRRLPVPPAAPTARQWPWSGQTASGGCGPHALRRRHGARGCGPPTQALPHPPQLLATVTPRTPRAPARAAPAHPAGTPRRPRAGPTGPLPRPLAPTVRPLPWHPALAGRQPGELMLWPSGWPPRAHAASPPGAARWGPAGPRACIRYAQQVAAVRRVWTGGSFTPHS